MKIYGQLQRAQVENKASDYTGGTAEGLVWVNTSTNLVKYDDGTNVKTLVTTDNSQILTNKTIDAASNTISNIGNTEIKAAAAIARSKIATGTINHVVINDGSTGALTSEAQLAISRGGTGQTAKTAAFDALAPTTTKGDVSAHNGTNNVRVAVGSDGQFLKADSAASAGVSWASATNNITVTSKTTTYTAVTSDDVILASTSGGGWTLGIYTAVGNSGKVIRIKKTTNDTNSLTIDPNASETVDGSTTIALTLQYESVTLVSDGTNWTVIAREMKLPKVRAYRNTSTQSIANNTTTKVQLNATTNDSYSVFDAITNFAFTAPRTGYYFLHGQVDFAGSATGVRQVYVFVNGAEVAHGRVDAPSAGNNSDTQVSDVAFLTKGDTADLRCFQTSGGALNVTNGTNVTYFDVVALPD